MERIPVVLFHATTGIKLIVSETFQKESRILRYRGFIRCVRPLFQKGRKHNVVVGNPLRLCTKGVSLFMATCFTQTPHCNSLSTWNSL